MIRRLWPTLLIIPLVLATFGCPPEASIPAARDYDLKGVVVSVDKPHVRITIDHEEIPGLMKAMKMPFAVPNPQMLDGFKAGDAVVGKVKKIGDKYIIIELQHRK